MVSAVVTWKKRLLWIGQMESRMNLCPWEDSRCTGINNFYRLILCSLFELLIYTILLSSTLFPIFPSFVVVISSSLILISRSLILCSLYELLLYAILLFSSLSSLSLFCYNCYLLISYTYLYISYTLPFLWTCYVSKFWLFSSLSDPFLFFFFPISTALIFCSLFEFWIYTSFPSSVLLLILSSFVFSYFFLISKSLTIFSIYELSICTIPASSVLFPILSFFLLLFYSHLYISYHFALTTNSLMYTIFASSIPFPFPFSWFVLSNVNLSYLALMEILMHIVTAYSNASSF